MINSVVYDKTFRDVICKCGHPYHRHFDSYEDMAPVGCKYCQCRIFHKTGKPINTIDTSHIRLAILDIQQLQLKYLHPSTMAVYKALDDAMTTLCKVITECEK